MISTEANPSDITRNYTTPTDNQPANTGGEGVNTMLNVETLKTQREELDKKIADLKEEEVTTKTEKKDKKATLAGFYEAKEKIAKDIQKARLQELKDEGLLTKDQYDKKIKLIDKDTPKPWQTTWRLKAIPATFLIAATIGTSAVTGAFIHENVFESSESNSKNNAQVNVSGNPVDLFTVANLEKAGCIAPEIAQIDIVRHALSLEVIPPDKRVEVCLAPVK